MIRSRNEKRRERNSWNSIEMEIAIKKFWRKAWKKIDWRGWRRCKNSKRWGLIRLHEKSNLRLLREMVKDRWQKLLDSRNARRRKIRGCTSAHPATPQIVYGWKNDPESRRVNPIPRLCSHKPDWTLTKIEKKYITSGCRCANAVHRSAVT